VVTPQPKRKAAQASAVVSARVRQPAGQGQHHRERDRQERDRPVGAGPGSTIRTSGLEAQRSTAKSPLRRPRTTSPELPEEQQGDQADAELARTQRLGRDAEEREAGEAGVDRRRTDVIEQHHGQLATAEDPGAVERAQRLSRQELDRDVGVRRLVVLQTGQGEIVQGRSRRRARSQSSARSSRREVASARRHSIRASGARRSGLAFSFRQGLDPDAGTTTDGIFGGISHQVLKLLRSIAVFETRRRRLLDQRTPDERRCYRVVLA
jgi:hypothetical protein